MTLHAHDIARGAAFAGIAVGSALVACVISRRTRESFDVSLSTALLLLTAISTGVAVQLRDGLFTPPAIVLLGVACAGAIAAVCVSRTRRVRHAEFIFAGAIALFIGLLGTMPPGVSMSVSGFERWSPFAISLTIAAVLGGVAPLVARAASPWFLLALIAVHVVIGVWIIRQSPYPRIDVYIFQRDAAAALVHGTNPYAITFHNPYGPGSWVYAPQVQQGDRLLFGYPYLPFTLAFTTAAHLIANDIRYAHLLATALSAALIGLSRPGRLAMLAATLFLFAPRSFYVMQQAWTEPFIVLALAVTVLCASRFPRATPYAFGLLLISKQFMPAAILFIPLLAPRGQRIGFAMRAVITAALITAPLVLWNPRAFWHSAVSLQFHQPFRFDSMSFLAAMSDVVYEPGAPPIGTPVRGATVIPFLALIFGAAIALWKVAASPRGFAAAIALTFLLFFAFNKQAFANYYFLVTAACFIAIAVGSSREEETSDN